MPKRKMLKIRPNYFLGFRIHNQQIQKASKEVQRLVVEKNPKFERALTNLAKLHVTLGVFHLENNENVQKLATILDRWAESRISHIFETPIVINFSNLGQFRNSVIFADIEKCHNYTRLCDLAKELNGLLKQEEFNVDDKKFQPHLTLLKLSKDKKLYKCKKEFNEVYEYLNEKEIDFGTQKIESIDLLSMTKESDDTGYYFCEHKILTPSIV